jgi:hypothetical protein
MKLHFALFLSLFSVWSCRSTACEIPPDSYYSTTMQEERDLTLEALAKSDLVLVGAVTEIRHGQKTKDPSDRISEVVVEVKQLLHGKIDASTVIIKAKLHAISVSCFGNEAFWDDQVDLGGEYIIFVASGHILSASPPAKDWKHLGLTGQREIVLSAVREGR